MSRSLPQPGRVRLLMPALVSALALYAFIGHGLHGPAMDGKVMHGAGICLLLSTLLAVVALPRVGRTGQVGRLEFHRAARLAPLIADVRFDRQTSPSWLQRFLC